MEKLGPVTTYSTVTGFGSYPSRGDDAKLATDVLGGESSLALTTEIVDFIESYEYR